MLGKHQKTSTTLELANKMLEQHEEDMAIDGESVQFILSTDELNDLSEEAVGVRTDFPADKLWYMSKEGIRELE